MKRILATLLALTLGLSLAGCGATEPPVQGPTTLPPEPAADVARLSAAVYPEMAPYPNESDYVRPDTFLDDAYNAAYDAWWSDIRAQREQAEKLDTNGLDGFLTSSIRQFLSGAGTENRVYSPLNVYMALAMLAELTDGESRAQILNLLGPEDIEALRTQAKALWNANYRDDGATKSVLASSLWLDEDVDYVQSTLDRLAETYYASSYRGEMGSDALNRALQGWLNEQTGGLLEEQAGGVELDADTILALATTIYLRAKWSKQFSESATEPDIFHAATGDMTAQFMRQSGFSSYRSYYWGENFSAVAQSLESGGAMWFLLPDEGATPEDLLSDDEAPAFLTAPGRDWANRKSLIVNLSVPKFDVASDLDLIGGLKALGVTDVFDVTASDFSPMTADYDDIYVSQAEHAARVKIDEDGVEAAAYTVMMMTETAMPPDEEIDFTLDRPFLFVITGADDLPLFAGIVNTP